MFWLVWLPIFFHLTNQLISVGVCGSDDDYHISSHLTIKLESSPPHWAGGLWLEWEQWTQLVDKSLLILLSLAIVHRISRITSHLHWNEGQAIAVVPIIFYWQIQWDKDNLFIILVNCYSDPFTIESHTYSSANWLIENLITDKCHFQNFLIFL